MKVQVVQDDQGKDTGVFIPMNEWLLIKDNYPDIEDIDDDIPQWEKDLIDQRLEAIRKNPKRVRPGKELLQGLKRKV